MKLRQEVYVDRSLGDLVSTQQHSLTLESFDKKILFLVASHRNFNIAKLCCAA